MNKKQAAASLGTEQVSKLDEADRAALAAALETDTGTRSAGDGNQGPEPVAHGGGDTPVSSPPSTPTAQSLTYAGHAAALCNEFFLRRFGPDKGLSPVMLDAITQDLAAALDAYFPNVEAKPGFFAGVALLGHFIACRTQQAKEPAKPSVSSDKAGAEKQPSSSIS